MNLLQFRTMSTDYTGLVAQSVTCLTADTSLTVDPWVAGYIPARSHTFVEIDHEIISTTILLPPTDSRRVVVSYKRESMCTEYWFQILLVKLAQGLFCFV